MVSSAKQDTLTDLQLATKCDFFARNIVDVELTLSSFAGRTAEYSPAKTGSYW